MTSRHAVITYHGVGRALAGEDPHELLVSEEAFRAQMAFLARHRNVVPLQALVQGRPRGRKPTVAITFDDAYRSVLHVAAPILREYGLASTVFAPTRWIGRENGWIEPPSSSLAIMDPNELRAADEQGITVESHGHAHLNYADADDDAVEGDVDASVQALGEILGRRPRYLAYPYGPATPVQRTSSDVAASMLRSPSSDLIGVVTSGNEYGYAGSWAAHLRFEDLRPLVGLVAMVTSGALGRGCVETIRPATPLTYGSRSTLFRSLACISRPIRKAKRTLGSGSSVRHSVCTAPGA